MATRRPLVLIGTGTIGEMPTGDALPNDAIPPDVYIDPSDHGFKAWSCDPTVLTASTVLSAGTLTGVRLKVRSAVTISSVSVLVFTAGASLGNVGFGLYNAAGTLLQSSVNTNGATVTAFQSTGLKTVTFTTPQSFAAGADINVGWWTTGTTQPALLRGTSLQAAMNPGLVSPNFRHWIGPASLTNVAPASIGAQTAPSGAFWAAAA